MEFEAQHRSGDTLTFLGEGLRKVPAFNPADHPVPSDGFRGFSDIILGEIVAKHEESGELVIRVAKIDKTFDKNQAGNAQSVIGKPIVIAGF